MQIILDPEQPISIHSLRMEGDGDMLGVTQSDIAFQSTPSAWRETWQDGVAKILGGISIHSLRMEGDAGRTCSRSP